MSTVVFPTASDPHQGQSENFVAATPAGGTAISWSAVFAGAAGAAVISLLLLILGVGLGLSSVSPWANEGASPVTFGISTVLWLTFTQLAASGLGGYLAGRLRIRWVGVPSDEVYFRDTAHGFLAWAVASLLTAAMLTSAIGAIVSGGVQAGATVAGGVANATVAATAAGTAGAATSMAQSDAGGPSEYLLDSLFRADKSGAGTITSSVDSAVTVPETSSDQAPAEVARIFMNSIRTGELPAEDVRYVGQLVAQRTGLSPQDAEKRVQDIYGETQKRLRDAEIAAREAVDKARKASAMSALWMFVALLTGAFVASLAATFGGKRRDT